MFIEIDYKYTGKTDRLVNNAYNYLLNKDLVGSICIVAYKMQISKRIKNLILDKVKENPNIHPKQYPIYSKKIMVSTNMFDVVLAHKSISKFYVIEFDYLEGDKFTLLEGSYYISSINPNNSIIRSKFFIPYICESIPNIERKYKISKVLNETKSFYSFINKEMNFKINEKIINSNDK